MNTMKTKKEKPLTPMERWMVQSNLNRIRDKKLDPKDVVTLLKRNGYPRIANAVKEAHEASQKDQTQITQELRSA